MKSLIVVIFSVLSLFCPSFILSPAYAVTKSSGDLEVTFSEPMFSSETVWYPGLEITKTLVVKNKGNSNKTVAIDAINTNQTGNMDSVLFFKVSQGGDIYGGSPLKTLRDFWGDNQVNLSTVEGDNHFNTYNVSVKMDNVDNAYQGKQASFDLIVGFVGSGDNITTTSTNQTTCNDNKPGSQPVITSAIPGINSVTLYWTQAADPVSYYLVAYGTTPGIPGYGNPNVGGRGASSYIVNGLSGGSTYYFKVRAGNGCSPGDFSSEVMAIPLGATVTGPAAGFSPGVLGVQENISTGESTMAGVLATQDRSNVVGLAGGKRNFDWRFFAGLIGAGILALYLVWYWRRRRKSD